MTPRSPRIQRRASVPPPLQDPEAAAPRRAAAKLVTAGVALLLYAGLLFSRLDHNVLWDDEANTALFADSVWAHGDTKAIIGKNIVAYRNGLELRGDANRLIAPMQYYVAAPFVGTIGGSLGPRLPFALVGLGAFLFAQFWLWKSGAPASRWLLVNIAFLGNVSLLLYARQARYYSIAVLLSMVIAYCYGTYDGSRKKLAGIALGSALLCCTHYIAFFSVAVAFLVDYALFGWRRRAFTWKEMAIVVAANLLIAGPVVAIWFPLGKLVTDYVPQSVWADRLTLTGWNLRELNGCEFGVLPLLALAPLLYLVRRPKPTLLLRLPLAILVGAAAITFVTPQPVGGTRYADIRYMVPFIPVCIFLAVLVIEALPLRWTAARVAVAVAVFGTNALQMAVAPALGTPYQFPVRSTLLAYLGELWSPLPSAYRAAADWLDDNAYVGETVITTPDFAAYPLMYHVPKLVYAWQLEDSKRAELPSLPDIHFKDHGTIDYFIGFGPSVADSIKIMRRLAERGVQYDRVASLPVNGRERTRPELFWHVFEPQPVRNAAEGINIDRRRESPPR